MVSNQHLMKEWRKKDFLIRNKDKRPKKGGGIFDKRARARLLGEARAYGGKEGSEAKSLSNFWGRIRRYVIGALYDFELFIVYSPSDQINQVITLESIKPIIKSYFQLGEFAELDFEKIKLAEHCIWVGFEYMKYLTHVSNRDKKTIENALEVSRGLANALELKIRKQGDLE